MYTLILGHYACTYVQYMYRRHIVHSTIMVHIRVHWWVQCTRQCTCTCTFVLKIVHSVRNSKAYCFEADLRFTNYNKPISDLKMCTGTYVCSEPQQALGRCSPPPPQPFQKFASKTKLLSLALPFPHFTYDIGQRWHSRPHINDRKL